MPTDAEALDVALAHHQAGRLWEAEQIYRQVLQTSPQNPTAWNLLGVLAAQAGNCQAGVECIGHAIQLNPNVADFHYNLGIALARLGKSNEAAAAYRNALQLRPDYPEVHNNLGIILQGQKLLPEAEACYRQSLYYRPGFAEACNNLGNNLKDQGLLDEAVAFFRQAVQLRPGFIEARNNLGNALRNQGQLDEAVAVLRQALELKPDYAEAQSSLGIALTRQGKLDEAARSFQRVAELTPNSPDAHNNLAISLRDQERWDEALAAFQRAVDLKPDFALAHFNRSVVHLLTGDFARGWAEFEWRWQAAEIGARPRHFTQPQWQGESLAGKTILLHAEQGLGDTLHFIRFAPLMKQRGARTIVECQLALRSLLSACPGVDQLITLGDPLPDFDVHAPLMSIPAILGTTLETISADIPYLHADPQLRERWRQKLSSLPGLKIGLCWQGNRLLASDALRSIPLVQFEPLARCLDERGGGVSLISLQKGDGVDQLHGLGGRFTVHDLGSDLDESTGPFLDTAAVISNLDLVITVDTAIAHLAGALGAPVWLLLPNVPDWRWLLNRDDSPWYPTMRLFRQVRARDWGEVFPRLVSALQQFANRSVKDA